MTVPGEKMAVFCGKHMGNIWETYGKHMGNMVINQGKSFHSQQKSEKPVQAQIRIL